MSQTTPKTSSPINYKTYKQQILKIKKKFAKEIEDTLLYFGSDDLDEDKVTASFTLPPGYAQDPSTYVPLYYE